MEKLFRPGLLIGILCASLSAFAQESYCVFKSEGNPRLSNSNILKKGGVLSKENSIIISQGDQVMLIDETGELYDLSEIRTYTYNEIASYKAKKEMASFSKKYFAYVWKQFSNKDNTKEHTGVVFRSDLLTLMVSPPDSTKVYLPEIEFSWTPKDEGVMSYFLLQHVTSGHITKIGVQGNSLVLFVDNELLASGKQYRWAVSSVRFPDLEKLTHYTFDVLNKKEFLLLKEDLELLHNDLIGLGFSKEQSKEMICRDYKICY